MWVRVAATILVAAAADSALDHVKVVFSQLKELSEAHPEVAENLAVQADLTEAETELARKFTVLRMYIAVSILRILKTLF